jgi:hypothetical protein
VVADRSRGEMIYYHNCAHISPPSRTCLGHCTHIPFRVVSLVSAVKCRWKKSRTSSTVIPDPFKTNSYCDCPHYFNLISCPTVVPYVVVVYTVVNRLDIVMLKYRAGCDRIVSGIGSRLVKHRCIFRINGIKRHSS